MKRYLCDGLQSYLQLHDKPGYIGHMPGHKRKCETKKADIAQVLTSLWQMDVTEVPGTDDLYAPQGFIRDSMDQLRGIYHTAASDYLVGGATVGILSAVCACTKPKDHILVARNCHKCVHHAIHVRSLEPVFLEVAQSEQYGIYGAVSADMVEASLAQDEKITAVVITSPTYEGVVSDVAALSKVAKRYGVRLIVDEAHGAHLPFYMPAFSAVTQGADVVVQSTHKTLCAMTQTALLHVNTKELVSEIEMWLSIFMTSSPSYVLLASIEDAVARACEMNWDKYKRNLQEFRLACQSLKKVRLVGQEELSKEFAFAYDETRLVFLSQIPGVLLAQALEQEGNVICEMAGEGYVVLISTMSDSKKDFDYLYAVLQSVDEGLGQLQMAGVDAESQTMVDKLSMEIGQISRQAVYVYPPGSYVIASGEKITPEHVHRLQGYVTAGLRLRQDVYSEHHRQA